MKKCISIVMTVLAFGIFNMASAQKIQKSEVPSVILNQFNVQFPKAKDVEWKIVGQQYKVEFELPRDKDHDVWYNSGGEIVKHKEELQKKDLPESIRKQINQEYKDYKIDDVDRITEGKSVVYVVEVEKRGTEIKLRYDQNGKRLQ